MPLIPVFRKQKKVDLLSLRPAQSTEFQDSQAYTEKPCLEKSSRALVVHAFNPSTQEAEAGGSL
ncbi:hypothetical protein I79_017098 [Cricetulus griseus]|uniref:Uncharacterized protein n=1 Tax=Cricetulus griseus TaxID=10029 RepID=G3I152_CRIGR|nr:hypothetical protein I79_017098 [Cricetulus griseus]